MKSFFQNKVNGLIVAISTVYTAILINVYLFLTSEIEAPGYMIYIFIIVVLMVSMCFLSDYRVKLAVFINRYPAKLVNIMSACIIIAASIFSFLLLTADKSSSPRTTVMYHGLISLLSFALIPVLNRLSHEPIVDVKILTKNVINNSEKIVFSSKDEFKLTALWNGNTEEVIQFRGFCLQNDENKLHSYDVPKDNIVFMPIHKTRSREKVSIASVPEQVKPYSLGREYNIRIKDILTALKSRKVKLVGNEYSLLVIYNDSEGNIFSKPIFIEMPRKREKDEYEIMQKKEKNIDDRYVYGILASLFCLGFGILIGAMINANGEVLGSVAEWIGGFGTIAAVIAGFAQVKNQNKIKKANDIEEKRPRFDVKSASTIKNYKEIVALACKHDTQIVKKVLQDNGSKYSKIQIINISPNVVYNLAIKLTYTDSCGENVIDTYSYSGFSSNEQLFIIPNDYSSKIKLTNMIIKFLTSAGELGFCEFSKGAKEEDMFEDAQYYFVNGNNSNVSGNEMGEMISREDTKFKKLDFKPSYMNNRFVIPPTTK